MNFSNTIQFNKQDKYNQINFFKVKKPFPIKTSLFSIYLKWLFQSTMDINAKMNLIRISKTHSEVKTAIKILKGYYNKHQISRRNQQLHQYLLSKRPSP